MECNQRPELKVDLLIILRHGAENLDRRNSVHKDCVVLYLE